MHTAFDLHANFQAIWLYFKCRRMDGEDKKTLFRWEKPHSVVCTFNWDFTSYLFQSQWNQNISDGYSFRIIDLNTFWKNSEWNSKYFHDCVLFKYCAKFLINESFFIWGGKILWNARNVINKRRHFVFRAFDCCGTVDYSIISPTPYRQSKTKNYRNNSNKTNKCPPPC